MNLSHFKMLTVTTIATACLAAGCGDEGGPVDDAGDATLQDAVGQDTGDRDTATADDAQDPRDTTTSDAVTDVPSEDQIVRFIFVSDIHFRVTEGQQRDDSYMEARINLINAIPDEFDLLVTGGDNFDHILPVWEEDPQNSPMSWFVQEMDKLDLPWVAAIGNHEFYDYYGDIPTLTDDGESRGQAFMTAMNYDSLYRVTEINGTKLIIMDSLEEGAWGETHGLMGKFSEEQFDWLRGELAEGKPSILFFHHPPGSFAPVSASGQLCDVISKYPTTVKGLFTGHLHGFYKGDYCGVPYYMVEDFRAAENKWFEVEYNATTDTLTILNEADIPFPVIPDFECQPGEAEITEPATATGTVQRMNVTEGISDATGLGEMLGEMLGAIPFVISFDGYGADTGFASRLSIASRWEIDNYLTYVDGSPCLELPLRWKAGSPCFEAGPVTMVVNIIPFLSAVSDDPINPEWAAALDIRNLVMEGRIGNDGNGVPVISDGIITATLMRDQTLNDMTRILVDEYCAGRTDSCTPGEGGLPACPETIDDAAVETIYAGIAYKCDTQIMGFGAQMMIDMVATLPDETHVTGRIGTEVLTVAPLESGGQIVDNLFATDAGMNCATE